MKKGKPTPKRTPPRKKAVRQKRSGKAAKPRWMLMAWTAFVVVGGIWLTLWWRGNAVTQGVAVTGMQHAEAEALLELVDADSGSAYYSINLPIIEGRVERHPWVAEAQALRGTDLVLTVDVTERVPALLVIDKNGRATHYLDAEGYQMPYVTGAAYDVPILRGFTEAYNPVQPIEDQMILDLLHQLTSLDPELDALVSAFNVRSDGTLDMETTPAPGRGSIRVRLGRDEFAGRLNRLRAFWRQRVLPEREMRFETIDLRYDSQIITQERPLGQ